MAGGKLSSFRQSKESFEGKMELLKSQLNFQHSSIVNQIVYNPPDKLAVKLDP